MTTSVNTLSREQWDAMTPNAQYEYMRLCEQGYNERQRFLQAITRERIEGKIASEIRTSRKSGRFALDSRIVLFANAATIEAAHMANGLMNYPVQRDDSLLDGEVRIQDDMTAITMRVWRFSDDAR